MPQRILVQRIYDGPFDEGHAILIDRIWPRGVSREEWPGESWRPAVAPSRELREWYGHAPQRFDEFRERYLAELEDNPAIDGLLAIDGILTLVTATKDVDRSHAAVLRDFLEDQVG